MNLSSTEIRYTLICYQIALSQPMKDSDRAEIALLYKKWLDTIDANGGLEALKEVLG